MRPYGIALLLCQLVLATPASAHAPIMGIGGVFGGFLHALLIPEHGMSLLALGLALGHQERTTRRVAVLIFGAVLVCGLIATKYLVEAKIAADILLAVTGILGLLVAFAWVPPFVGWTLAALTAAAFALDSSAEVPSAGEAARMLFGAGLGAVMMLALVAEGAVALASQTQRIAMRVVGSWITAIAILDLALRFATRSATG